MGVAVTHRRPPSPAVDVGGQTTTPFGEGRLVVSVPGSVRAPLPVPHLHRVEPRERVHENARDVRSVRVGRYAQTTGLVYLVQIAVDHPVADAIPPLDHLPRLDAERQPMPCVGGDLLAQNHQEIVARERSPRTMPYLRRCARWWR